MSKKLGIYWRNNWKYDKKTVGETVPSIFLNSEYFFIEFFEWKCGKFYHK